MDRKARELIEDERAKHEGRYYDAGLWMGLNWVLEDAEEEAVENSASVLDAVCIRKRHVIEDLKAAREKLKGRKKKSIGYNSRDGMYIYEDNVWSPADRAEASFLAGELEGLEVAIEILKGNME